MRLNSVVMSTLLYHPAFAHVIPLLRGNSDANNQSNLRNFSAYIIIQFMMSVSSMTGVHVDN